MKKLAVLLAVMMAVGSVPGFSLEPTVDNFVDTHTKSSSLRPVQDTGLVYSKVNHEIGKGMDKVPVLNEREKVVGPLDKFLHHTIDGTKALTNGLWDILTFKSLREKK